MTEYVIRRLLLNLVVIWLVATFVFVAVRVLPGDYAAQQVSNQFFSGSVGGSDEAAVKAALHEARERLGMNDPVIIQYAKYWGDILRGDFGNSFQQNRSAWGLMTDALPYSLQLGMMSLVIALLIALPVGIVSATRQDSALDGVFRVIAVLGLAAPGFFTAALLTLIVLRFDLFTIDVVGAPGLWEDPIASFQLFIIPALAGGLASGAILMRILRSQLLDVLRQDYVRTAWSKGLRERVIITRHVLRNALIPVVTVIGFIVGAAVGGNVILESMFRIPGMGTRMLQAIQVRDVPIVQMNALVIAIGVVTVNLLVDLSYFLIDPRVTVKGSR